MPGTFIISIDFEIHWGVYDTKTLNGYGANLRGVRQAIPQMLDLFAQYDVQTTFATVGLLFYRDKETLLQSLPKRLPGYENTALNPYLDIENLLGKDEASDPYHYGRSMLELITKSGKHEVGSHTFCHFYCLEKGQTIFEFEEDLAAFSKAAQTMGISPTSLVFPRNQLRYNYLRSLKKFGYTCYRGNENSWVYKPHVKRQENLLRRGVRFLDAYFNLTGEHLHEETELIKDYPFNIKASRFFRPYKTILAPLEPFKLRRIKNSMRTAAKEDKIFHLWWHPHNFGINIDQNLKSLEKVLKEYDKLRQSHDFRNYTMSGYADFLKSKYHVGT